ncbi:glycosyltransferase [Sphingomonas limnosediminicola]|uniref:Glycosyltransferase n=1 Tax=Sphingomonas limnosediminicola TaxID=940133 RepID=A0ABP7L4X9_9SPHN
MTDRGVRIGYLTSQYPATSHTFISREVAALRKLGVPLETFSVRPPLPDEMRDEKLRSEAEATFTIFNQRATGIMAAQLAMALTNPVEVSRTLVRALRHRPPGVRGFALAFVYFAEALVLARELRRQKITHLHNHFANAGAIVGMLASRLLQIPWSFTMHGISETDYPAGLMLGRKIEAAEFVACVSYFGRAQAMRVVEPDQWPKLLIVRCGLDLTVLPRRRPRGPVVRLISVGRLSPEKGQAGLLAAFSEARRDYPNLKLEIVGDGPDLDKLQQLAADLNLTQSVTFAGRCGEQQTLERIVNADCLVLTSFMEGLPVVLMEAMALGTPVIASRIAGIPELIEHGESGLLFTPSDWHDLANCIRGLTRDDALRSRVAAQARVVVEREFDIEQSARTLAAIFLNERVR